MGAQSSRRRVWSEWILAALAHMSIMMSGVSDWKVSSEFYSSFLMRQLIFISLSAASIIKSFRKVFIYFEKYQQHIKYLLMKSQCTSSMSIQDIITVLRGGETQPTTRPSFATITLSSKDNTFIIKNLQRIREEIREGMQLQQQIKAVLSAMNNQEDIARYAAGDKGELQALCKFYKQSCVFVKGQHTTITGSSGKNKKFWRKLGEICQHIDKKGVDAKGDSIREKKILTDNIQQLCGYLTKGDLASYNNFKEFGHFKQAASCLKLVEQSFKHLNEIKKQFDQIIPTKNIVYVKPTTIVQVYQKMSTELHYHVDKLIQSCEGQSKSERQQPKLTKLKRMINKILQTTPGNPPQNQKKFSTQYIAPNLASEFNKIAQMKYEDLKKHLGAYYTSKDLSTTLMSILKQIFNKIRTHLGIKYDENLFDWIENAHQLLIECDQFRPLSMKNKQSNNSQKDVARKTLEENIELQQQVALLKNKNQQQENELSLKAARNIQIEEQLSLLRLDLSAAVKESKELKEINLSLQRLQQQNQRLIKAEQQLINAETLIRKNKIQYEIKSMNVYAAIRELFEKIEEQKQYLKMRTRSNTQAIQTLEKEKEVLKRHISQIQTTLKSCEDEAIANNKQIIKSINSILKLIPNSDNIAQKKYETGVQAIQDYINLSKNTTKQNEEQINILKIQNNSLSNELDTIKCYLGIKSQQNIMNSLKKASNMQEKLFEFIRHIEQIFSGINDSYSILQNKQILSEKLPLLLNQVELSHKKSQESLNQKVKDVSRALVDSDQHSFIFRYLQKYRNQRILTFDIIYRKGQHQQQHKRPFLDKLPHVLVLLKIDNEFVVGCYSTRSCCGKFDEKETGGLLFSISGQKIYHLKKDQRAMTKDEYNLVCGSNNMVIDSEEKVVTSDWNTVSNFDVGSDKLMDFWGSMEIKQKIVEFEIFRVHFQNESVSEVIQPQVTRGRLSSPSVRKMIDPKFQKQNLEQENRDLKNKVHELERYRRQYTALKKSSDPEGIFTKQIEDLKKQLAEYEVMKFKQQSTPSIIKRISLLHRNKPEQKIEEKIEENIEENIEEKTKDERYEQANRLYQETLAKLGQANEKIEHTLGELKDIKSAAQKLKNQKDSVDKKLTQTLKDLQELKKQKERIQKKLSDHIEIAEQKKQKQLQKKQDEQKKQEQTRQKISQVQAQQSVDAVQQELNAIKKQIVEKQQQLDKINDEFQKISKSLKTNQQQNIDLEDKLAKNKPLLHQELQNLRVTQQSLQKARKDLQSFDRQNQDQQKLLKKEQQEIEALLKKKRAEEQQLFRLDQKIKTAKDDFEKTKKDSENFEAANSEFKAMMVEKRKLAKQLQELKSDIADNEAFFQTKQQQFNDLEAKISQTRQELQKLDQSRKEIDRVQTEIQQKNEHLSKIRKQSEQANKAFEEATKKLKLENDQLRAAQQKHQTFKQDLEIIENKLTERKELLQKANSTSVNFANSSAFFNGETIQHPADGQYLVEQLKAILPNKTIVRTKLLYMFPQMAKINFHECVDNQPDFVIVIRLKNGQVVAFYSEVGLAKEADSSNCNGFLASLTNKRAFFLKRNMPQAKLFVYDPYFMQIGNGDLRIQLHNFSGPITSNIGMRHCYFDPEGEVDPQKLLGSSEKTSQAESYEVFQVISR